MSPVGAISLRDALAGATGRLAAAGCASPRLDAELLSRAEQIQGDPIGVGGVVANVEMGEEAESQALRAYKMRQSAEAT